jgi:hypothetical protein
MDREANRKKQKEGKARQVSMKNIYNIDPN